MTLESDAEEQVIEDEIVEDNIEDLVLAFEAIMGEQLVKEGSMKKARKLRKLRIKCFRQMMRAAFLSNPLATAKDFKRLWPRIFDESLIEFGKSAHLEAMERVFDGISVTDDDVEPDDGETIGDAM